VTVQGFPGTYPSAESYTTIYLIAAAMSSISIVLALRIRHSLQNKPQGEFQTKAEKKI
jgi:hypothetical protein